MPISPTTLPPVNELTPAEDIPPSYIFTNVFEPSVHKSLRPLLTRGTLGKDANCFELLVQLVSYTVVIVKDGRCGCCRGFGSLCIAAAHVAYDAGRKHVEIHSRCVNCTLKHQTCDLPPRTTLPTCTCDWNMPDSDRKVIADWHRHCLYYSQQVGMPLSKRVGLATMNFLRNRLFHYSNWFAQHTEVAYQIDLDQLEPAKRALGVTNLVRADGRWIIPYRTKWEICPCYPAEDCNADKHYAPTETDDEDYHRSTRQPSATLSDEQWEHKERSSGYPQDDAKIVPIPGHGCVVNGDGCREGVKA